MDGRISNLMQVASIRRYTLTDGRGAGLSIVDCDTGSLRFLLNLTKGCDIMQLYHEGQNMSFVSKNGFKAESGDFLRRFEGGMLYTCGLDSVGGRDGYPIHGNYHNNPAELTRCECSEEGIVVEATVRDTSLFGQNLVLRRKITAAVGGDTLTVEDTLLNEGYREEGYAILYHVNVGYPMLSEGARVLAELESCTPRTEWSKATEGEMLTVSAPVPNQEEMCYFLKLKKPEIALENPAIGKRLSVTYSENTLPNLVLWRSMASGDYALGLEPATTLLDGGFAYRYLAPGESVRLSVAIRVERV